MRSNSPVTEFAFWAALFLYLVGFSYRTQGLPVQNSSNKNLATDGAIARAPSSPSVVLDSSRWFAHDRKLLNYEMLRQPRSSDSGSTYFAPTTNNPNEISAPKFICRAERNGTISIVMLPQNNQPERRDLSSPYSQRQQQQQQPAYPSQAPLVPTDSENHRYFWYVCEIKRPVNEAPPNYPQIYSPQYSLTEADGISAPVLSADSPVIYLSNSTTGSQPSVEAVSSYTSQDNAVDQQLLASQYAQSPQYNFVQQLRATTAANYTASSAPAAANTTSNYIKKHHWLKPAVLPPEYRMYNRTPSIMPSSFDVDNSQRVPNVYNYEPEKPALQQQYNNNSNNYSGPQQQQAPYVLQNRPSNSGRRAPPRIRVTQLLLNQTIAHQLLSAITAGDQQNNAGNKEDFVLTNTDMTSGGKSNYGSSNDRVERVQIRISGKNMKMKSYNAKQ